MEQLAFVVTTVLVLDEAQWGKVNEVNNISGIYTGHLLYVARTLGILYQTFTWMTKSEMAQFCERQQNQFRD